MEEKRILELNEYDFNAMIRVLNDKRTELSQNDVEKEIVSNLLLKVINAPIKKLSFYVKKEKKAKKMQYER